MYIFVNGQKIDLFQTDHPQRILSKNGNFEIDSFLEKQV